MLSSLRSRLLLSYALLIGVVLCVVGIALVFFILRNPIIDRQVYTRLEGIADLIIRQEMLLTESKARLEGVIKRIDQQGDVRVLILGETGEVLLDSQSEEAARLAPKIRPLGQFQRGIALDEEQNAWYTVWERLENDTILVLATRRVGRISLLFSQRLGELLRDDLLPPLLQGGFVALILALILSFWMANWIAAPLRRMSEAIHQVASGQYDKVTVEGPKEVRSLAKSFNEMTNRVIASQQSQKDFVANVSHELKTPLTSIQGFAQAVVDGTIRSKEEIENAAAVIHMEAGRMHRMVVELLDLARLEAGTLRMERAAVDIDALLQRALEKFKPQAASGEIRLIYERQDTPIVIGDGDRLMQVLTNLIDNAIKFTPAGGSVTIQSGRDADQFVLEVEDTGKGIDPEEASRIFERFYQVDKARAGVEGRGTGLGLAITKEIIQAHGGRITVESQPGVGSRFVVKIPFAQPDDTTIVRRRKKKAS